LSIQIPGCHRSSQLENLWHPFAVTAATESAALGTVIIERAVALLGPKNNHNALKTARRLL
jgi:hypothetical protein